MIRPATPADLDALLPLRQSLWPDSPLAEHRRDLEATLNNRPAGPYPTAIFLTTADNSAIGFVEVGLRSHADGCDPARPVGYLEGWYVVATHRGRGIGRQLVHAAEDWARTQGCKEMASDTWLDADASLRAHQSLGYIVVDRCINLRKPL